MTNTVHTATACCGRPAPRTCRSTSHAYKGMQMVTLTTPASTSSSASCTRSCSAASSSTTRRRRPRPRQDDHAAQRSHGSDGLESRVPPVRSFINITNPQNYQTYTKTGSTWDPKYPAVPVRVYDGNAMRSVIPNLDEAFQSYFHEPVALPAATPPTGRERSGLDRHRVRADRGEDEAGNRDCTRRPTGR